MGRALLQGNPFVVAEVEQLLLEGELGWELYRSAGARFGQAPRR